MSFFDHPTINLTVTGWTLGAAAGVYKGCSLLASAVTTSHKVKAAALILASLNVFASAFLLMGYKQGKKINYIKSNSNEWNVIRKIAILTINLHVGLSYQAIKYTRKHLSKY